MTIIEMAKVAKPGQYWTCTVRGFPKEAVRMTDRGYFTRDDAFGCPCGFHVKALTANNWRRCTQDGAPLEVSNG